MQQKFFIKTNCNNVVEFNPLIVENIINFTLLSSGHEDNPNFKLEKSDINELKRRVKTTNDLMVAVRCYLDYYFPYKVLQEYDFICKYRYKPWCKVNVHDIKYLNNILNYKMSTSGIGYLIPEDGDIIGMVDMDWCDSSYTFVDIVTIKFLIYEKIEEISKK